MMGFLRTFMFLLSIYYFLCVLQRTLISISTTLSYHPWNPWAISDHALDGVYLTDAPWWTSRERWSPISSAKLDTLSRHHPSRFKPDTTLAPLSERESAGTRCYCETELEKEPTESAMAMLLDYLDSAGEEKYTIVDPGSGISVNAGSTMVWVCRHRGELSYMRGSDGLLVDSAFVQLAFGFIEERCGVGVPGTFGEEGGWKVGYGNMKYGVQGCSSDFTLKGAVQRCERKEVDGGLDGLINPDV